jgi:hypothetical protein
MMKSQEGLSELGPGLLHKEDPMLVQVKPELGQSFIFFSKTKNYFSISVFDPVKEVRKKLGKNIVFYSGKFTLFYFYFYS